MLIAVPRCASLCVFVHSLHCSNRDALFAGESPTHYLLFPQHTPRRGAGEERRGKTFSVQGAHFDLN